MSFLNLFSKQPKRCGQPEWHGQAFDVDDERIPEPIKKSVMAYYQDGMTLFFTNTKLGGEWWLLDHNGDLIEAFWLK